MVQTEGLLALTLLPEHDSKVTFRLTLATLYPCGYMTPDERKWHASIPWTTSWIWDRQAQKAKKQPLWLKRFCFRICVLLGRILWLWLKYFNASGKDKVSLTCERWHNNGATSNGLLLRGSRWQWCCIINAISRLSVQWPHLPPNSLIGMPATFHFSLSSHGVHSKTLILKFLPVRLFETPVM